MAMTNKVGAAADPQTFGGLQLRVAVLCGLIQALDGYDLSAIGLAVPSLTKAWSLPPSAFTQAFALSSVGIMVGAMAAGPIADRFGRKPVLLLSVALFGLFSLLSAWAPSLPMLVALRFFTGIGIGGAMPTTVALTSDYTPDRWRTSVVMFMFTGNTIGGFFAGQIAAQILPRWGWQGIFYVGGIVPLVLLVVLIFILPESPQFQGGARPAAAQANPVSGLFADGLAVSTLLLWAIFLINLLNMYLIGYWLPTVLNLEGFSPADAAFAASIYSLGGIMITLLLGPDDENRRVQGPALPIAGASRYFAGSDRRGFTPERARCFG
jgi:AAHS family 4-hydroxybenzoate transporter-like MFS transporter